MAYGSGYLGVTFWALFLRLRINGHRLWSFAGLSNRRRQSLLEQAARFNAELPHDLREAYCTTYFHGRDLLT
ncbi:uncharacterized protein METZ01_LOCUS290529 [marine metagenome]|uniref:Uncharacterized protein n=1 Tax=marine metagenome TaxID=408172 RepID=A0A382LPJ4_9ZZZZ